jgi:hypothetical protein
VCNETKPLVSPVPSLLGSNARPPNAELAAIRSTLLETEAGLLELDDEIDALEAILEQRRQDRQALREFCNAHAALLSPINRLPTELLAEIFVLRTQEARHASILGAVCNHWRQLALSTPRLWCTINEILDQDDPDSQADKVLTWLQRSVQCPISVTLEQDDDDDSDNHPVIDIIVHHSHQLRFLKITIGPTILQAFSSLKGRLPILQTLVLYKSGWDDIDAQECDIFLDAPQLCALDMDYPLTSLEFPFTQITRCSTSMLDSDECLHIMLTSPNITTCEFDHMDDYLNAHTLPVVSHLSSLSIQNAFLDLGRFFGFLTLPTLRDFSISLGSSVAPWPQTEFLSLVSRSSWQLEKLTLRCHSMSSEDLIHCLEVIPSLHELEISEPLRVTDGLGLFASGMVDDNVLQKLTCPTGSEGQLPLAPLLRTVRFRGVRNFEDQRLFEMVESRWCGGLPKGLERLQRVYVRLDRDLRPESRSRAQALREQGLDIYFFR